MSSAADFPDSPWLLVWGGCFHFSLGQKRKKKEKKQHILWQRCCGESYRIMTYLLEKDRNCEDVRRCNCSHPDQTESPRDASSLAQTLVWKCNVFMSRLFLHQVRNLLQEEKLQPESVRKQRRSDVLAGGGEQRVRSFEQPQLLILPNTVQTAARWESSRRPRQRRVRTACVAFCCKCLVKLNTKPDNIRQKNPDKNDWLSLSVSQYAALRIISARGHQHGATVLWAGSEMQFYPILLSCC